MVDKKKIVELVREKVAQNRNTYTKSTVAALAKEMKESANPDQELEDLFFTFQEEHRVTRDKAEEILINKLKVIYQVDLVSSGHAQALDDLITTVKERDTWT